VFTGLIADVGRVVDVDATADGARMRVLSSLASELNEGDSIAVNGVCLTATHLSDGAFTVDAMNQTLNVTTLGGLRPGASANLELAVRATDRLGGHLVQGHVDGVGGVVDVRSDGFSRHVEVAFDGELMRYVVAQGSVTLDGVSLTVAECSDDGFTVALIPETLERTTLSELEPASTVNVEVDVLAKYVERLLAGVTR